MDSHYLDLAMKTGRPMRYINGTIHSVLSLVNCIGLQYSLQDSLRRNLNELFLGFTGVRNDNVTILSLRARIKLHI